MRNCELHTPTMGPPTQKRKRVVLTVAQKIEICTRLEQGENAASLSNRYNVGISTIYDVKSNRDKLLNLCTKSSSPKTIIQRRSLRDPKCDQVDAALYDWFTDKRSNGIKVSGPMLLKKAKYLYKELEIIEPLAFSNGWLLRFKQRHEIRSLYMPAGERGTLKKELADESVATSPSMIHSEVLPQVGYSLKFDEMPTSSQSLGTPKSTSNEGMGDDQPSTDERLKINQTHDLHNAARRTRRKGSGRKRVLLNIGQKIKICKDLERGKKPLFLCNKYNIGRSTLYEIKAKRDELMNICSNSQSPHATLQRRTLKASKCDELDTALLRWFSEKNGTGDKIPRSMLLKKAKDLYKELEITEPLSISSSWISRFKHRHGIQRLYVTKQKETTDRESSDENMEIFPSIAHGEVLPYDYLPNADENELPLEGPTSPKTPRKEALKPLSDQETEIVSNKELDRHSMRNNPLSNGDYQQNSDNFNHTHETDHAYHVTWKEAANSFDVIVKFAEERACYTPQEVANLQLLKEQFSAKRQSSQKLLGIVKLE